MTESISQFSQGINHPFPLPNSPYLFLLYIPVLLLFLPEIRKAFKKNREPKQGYIFGMGRSPCCDKEHTNKGAWSPEEDQLLLDYIRLHGQGCWRSLPKAAGLLRCGKSCRLRWMNYLRPDLKRGNFTEEEDELIIKLHSLLGNKWSLIAGRLAGRTDNEVKNYWNTHIKRKLLSRGFDPQTHRPLSVAATVKSEIKSTLLTNPASSLPVLDTSSVSRIIEFGKASFPADTRFNVGSGDSSSMEGGSCSSGTTTTDDDGSRLSIQEAKLRKGEETDLDLGIGLLRFRSQQASTAFSATNASAESIPAQEHRFIPVSPAPATAETVAVEGVCLCFQLGFHSGRTCSCCQTSKVASL